MTNRSLCRWTRTLSRTTTETRIRTLGACFPCYATVHPSNGTPALHAAAGNAM